MEDCYAVLKIVEGVRSVVVESLCFAQQRVEALLGYAESFDGPRVLEHQPDLPEEVCRARVEKINIRLLEVLDLCAVQEELRALGQRADGGEVHVDHTSVEYISVYERAELAQQMVFLARDHCLEELCEVRQKKFGLAELREGRLPAVARSLALS